MCLSSIAFFEDRTNALQPLTVSASQTVPCRGGKHRLHGIPASTDQLLLGTQARNKMGETAFRPHPCQQRPGLRFVSYRTACGDYDRPFMTAHLLQAVPVLLKLPETKFRLASCFNAATCTYLLRTNHSSLSDYC